MALKILVIEDDPDILEIIEFVLKDEGYEVVTSTDGSKLKEVHTIAPDLVFLDEMLEEDGGTDLCRALKDNPASSHIPVILMSAFSHVDELAQEACADGFLQKPFEITELSEIINRYC